MKYYEIVEPVDCINDTTPIYTVLSEEDIIDKYFVYEALMFLTCPRLGYIPAKQQVIDEFIICHWARELI